MLNRFLKVSVFLVIIALISCKKDEPNTGLGGETNIPLTAVDSVSSVYAELDGVNALSTEIRIKSNNDGDVTYTGSVDLLTLSPELQTKALEVLNEHGDYYDASEYVTLTPDMKLNFEFKVKITSEGYQDFFTNGQPWIMAKYNDPVGTTYSVVNKNGETLTRTITEKTGLDDWPFGFFLIKTVKVEQQLASDDPMVDHIEYRVNHKFGLVYIEYLFKDGTNLAIEVIPWFLL
ncbi:MAG: hypothetical protein Q7T20_08065 [Saprospiraceae bacterium]|nr:hypothetical protein [Saprospiraceae bacterium]